MSKIPVAATCGNNGLSLHNYYIIDIYFKPMGENEVTVKSQKNKRGISPLLSISI